MKTLPPQLQARLDSGVTTLARCWIVRRHDGVALGFTDHDCDIDIDGVRCRAGTGFAGSEASAKLGFAIDGAEVEGVLADASLNDDDLSAGRFDAARVETYIVDWSDPALRVALPHTILGEVKRAGRAFTAELRGLADLLAQEKGRLYTAACSADLGDARCGIDRLQPAWRGLGTITAIDGAASFVAGGLAAFAGDWFTGGRLVWTSGANRGLGVEIKAHRVDGGAVRLILWEPPAQPLATGDAFSVTAGCDKSFAQCRARFGNGVNFRGFPHIPGNDFVMQYPTPGR